MNTLKDVKCVLFDYGNVVSQPQKRLIADQMATLVGLEPDVFEKAYFKERRAYDRGDVEGAEYWRILARRMGIQLDETKFEKLIELDIACWAEVDQRILELAADIKNAGHEIGILSNMPIDQVGAYKKMDSWMGTFDHLFLSAEFRMAKPDAEIYEYVMREAGKTPEEIFFIDDKTENLEVASQIGWQTFLYSSPDDFEALRSKCLGP